ncbi:MAG: hypothetical protein US49_C0002G0098 [candidate division TM6 bacterium GW2011_GWF2_37_49]|nr:MAG: hypothetical protein US49_C0002G0098 [candidate division TM6 bacterium GW2011_GWF2_37_49]
MVMFKLCVATIIFFVELFAYTSAAYQGKFENFQEAVKKESVEDKISKYLKKGSEVSDHFLVTENQLFMFATKIDKLNKNPEFVLRFGSRQAPKFFVKKSLHGLRVAIDPGHLGGRMAFIEERFVDMSLPDNTRIQFDEGTLATVTAKILKQYLIAVGAEVLLTRDEPGKSVYTLSFDAWCAKSFAITSDRDWLDPKKQQVAIDYLKNHSPSFMLFKSEAPEKRLTSIIRAQDASAKVVPLKKALFRLCYNSLDLNARAEKINSFKPDLTIIIHFNASGGAHDISAADYNLAFVPGSFLDGELKDLLSREEFVRLSLSDDIKESVKLSRAVVKNMEKMLNVSTMKNSQYQPNGTIFVENGIYCRNLALTRLVHGPICYGETLIQNNPEEAVLLSQKDCEIDGVSVSSRLKNVAGAYFQGILDYFEFNGQHK